MRPTDERKADECVNRNSVVYIYRNRSIACVRFVPQSAKFFDCRDCKNLCRHVFVRQEMRAAPVETAMTCTRCLPIERTGSACGAVSPAARYHGLRLSTFAR